MCVLSELKRLVVNDCDEECVRVLGFGIGGDNTGRVDWRKRVEVRSLRVALDRRNSAIGETGLVPPCSLFFLFFIDVCFFYRSSILNKKNKFKS